MMVEGVSQMSCGGEIIGRERGTFALYNVTAGREGTVRHESCWCGSAIVSVGHEVIEFCHTVASCNDKTLAPQASAEDVRE
jgi:hypothetical protein